jgi:hypothetical protein
MRRGAENSRTIASAFAPGRRQAATCAMQVAGLSSIEMLPLRKGPTPDRGGIGGDGGVDPSRQILVSLHEPGGVLGEAQHVVNDQHLTVALSARPYADGRAFNGVSDGTSQGLDDGLDNDGERASLVERPCVLEDS